MKNLYFLLLFILVAFAARAQQNPPPYLSASLSKDSIITAKTNPILFTDFYFGYSGGGSHGFTGSVSVNYQLKEHLFTARASQLLHYKTQIITPVFPFPLSKLQESIDEYGLLYGRRYAKDNHAFSFSAGAAFMHRKKYVITADDSFYVTKNTFGVPFEASVKWFKRRKAPYRIYGVIPIGKPTAFGNSFGFKLLGNVSKTTFVGLGITVGFGYHKYY